MSDPLEDARNYLRQALGALMECSDQRKWQPIETAPKDGTAILLWWKYCPHPSVGCWDMGLGDESSTRYACHPQGWICECDDCIPKNQQDCTHWMPLPEPPK